MLTTEKKVRGPRGNYQPRFHWTVERLATLAEAYALLQGSAKKMTVMARLIASDNSWPYRPVLNKLYQLREKQRADESARKAITPGT